MSLSGLFRGPPPDSEEEVEDEAKRAQDTLVFAACVVGLIDGTDLFLGPPPDSEVEDEAKRSQDTLVFATCVGLTDGTDRLKTREEH